MELISQYARERMLANGWRNVELIVKDREPEDFPPVVKLFCPWGGATWLLTELEPENPDIAFGLCDLGVGFPELGRVSLTELESVIGPGGLRIERDIYFKPEKTLQGYADEARGEGRITA